MIWIKFSSASSSAAPEWIDHTIAKRAKGKTGPTAMAVAFNKAKATA
jgi:hypothetical protein